MKKLLVFISVLFGIANAQTIAISKYNDMVQINYTLNGVQNKIIIPRNIGSATSKDGKLVFQAAGEYVIDFVYSGKTFTESGNAIPSLDSAIKVLNKAPYFSFLSGSSGDTSMVRIVSNSFGSNVIFNSALTNAYQTTDSFLSSDYTLFAVKKTDSSDLDCASIIELQVSEGGGVWDVVSSGLFERQKFTNGGAAIDTISGLLNPVTDMPTNYVIEDATGVAYIFLHGTSADSYYVRERIDNSFGKWYRFKVRAADNTSIPIESTYSGSNFPSISIKVIKK